MKLVKEHIKESVGIKPLKYIPPFEGDIDLSDKGITKLPKDLPKKIIGSFYCSNNKLTSLEGVPTSVDGGFYCYYNNLTSLEGAPTSVGGDFICYYNNLISLVGAPTLVGGDFYCSYNKLTSLKGAPTSVGGDFYCYGNNIPKEEIERYYRTGAVQRTIYSDHGEYRR